MIFGFRFTLPVSRHKTLPGKSWNWRMVHVSFDYPRGVTGDSPIFVVYLSKIRYVWII